MKTKRMTDIIVEAYGKKYDLAPRQAPRHAFWDELGYRLRAVAEMPMDVRLRWLLGFCFLVLAAATIYYYNTLIGVEHDVMKSRAQVDVFMQRRNDISINLAKALQDYSHYEKNVLTEIVKLRTALGGEGANPGAVEELLKNAGPAAPAGTAPAGAAGLSSAALARLLAVAEQYPDLKLSANFQSLMAALVEVEKDLAGERVKFNEAILAYANYVDKFPSNFFALCFGFRMTPYFKATQDAQVLTPISY
ncbi:LemA family protein [Solidesulfovibrio magneticus]|uniref:LemA family protein n=1 Tax=Solidesulfovibrio magneticus TaxID=184917 RepID=UPI0002D48EF7|nr:LemA family protein [Solidesulfovibrio magneticus]